LWAGMWMEHSVLLKTGFGVSGRWSNSILEGSQLCGFSKGLSYCMFIRVLHSFRGTV